MDKILPNFTAKKVPDDFHLVLNLQPVAVMDIP